MPLALLGGPGTFSLPYWTTFLQTACRQKQDVFVKLPKTIPERSVLLPGRQPFPFQTAVNTHSTMLNSSGVSWQGWFILQDPVKPVLLKDTYKQSTVWFQHILNAKSQILFFFYRFIWSREPLSEWWLHLPHIPEATWEEGNPSRNRKPSACYCWQPDLFTKPMERHE